MQKLAISDLLHVIPDSSIEDFIFNNRDNKVKIVQLGILRLLNSDLFYSEMMANGSFNDFTRWVTSSTTRVSFIRKKYEWSDPQVIAFWTLLGSADLLMKTVPDPEKNGSSPITIDRLNRRSMGILQITKGTKALGLNRLRKAGLKSKVNHLSDEAEAALEKCRDELFFRSDSLVNYLVTHPIPQRINYSVIWNLPFDLQPENVHVNFKSAKCLGEAQKMLVDALFPVVNTTNLSGENSSGSVEKLLQDLENRVQEAEGLRMVLKYATPGVNTSVRGRLNYVLGEMDEVVEMLRDIT